MIAHGGLAAKPDHQRIVITGVGLTAPNGNNLPEFREALLAGRSGVSDYEIRYVGETLAGICNFDGSAVSEPKDIRRGTRAGSIGIYCAAEAIADAGLDWPNVDKSRVGIYVGVTEHGNVETENEIYQLSSFRLRHGVLVAPPQSADGRQQPGRRSRAEPGRDRPALHDRRRVRRGQRRADSRRTNAAARRMRCGARRRRFGKHSHVRHLRQLQEPRRARHRTPIRPRPRGRSTCSATASSSPKVAACMCSSGSTTRSAAARRSTANSSAMR